MRTVRLYTENDLAAGLSVTLPSAQAHYLGHVMRLKAGAPVALFNGRDGEWRATVNAISKKQCDLSVTEQTRKQEMVSDLWLVFAPIKKTRTDFIVEKATELGAARLLPVFTENTASTRVNIERLQAISIESAEQCERLDIPAIDAAQPLGALCQNWPASRILYVLDEMGHETGRAEPIISALESLKQSTPLPPVGFLTGPEGGFGAGELDGLRKLPFVKTVTLGSRILRAETAVAAALACFQAVTDQS